MITSARKGKRTKVNDLMNEETANVKDKVSFLSITHKYIKD